MKNLIDRTAHEIVHGIKKDEGERSPNDEEVILFENEESKDTMVINRQQNLAIFKEYDKVDFNTYGYDWLEVSMYSIPIPMVKFAATKL